MNTAHAARSASTGRTNRKEKRTRKRMILKRARHVEKLRQIDRDNPQPTGRIANEDMALANALDHKIASLRLYMLKLERSARTVSAANPLIVENHFTHTTIRIARYSDAEEYLRHVEAQIERLEVVRNDLNPYADFSVMHEELVRLRTRVRKPQPAA